MRILYVTNGFPYPLTSGFLRHYFLIRELSSRHAVSLLSIVGAGYAGSVLAGTESVRATVLCRTAPPVSSKLIAHQSASCGTAN